MPVGEMLRRMDSVEITEWMAYYELQRDGPGAAAAEEIDDPEELSKRLKAALFRKAN